MQNVFDGSMCQGRLEWVSVGKQGGQNHFGSSDSKLCTKILKLKPKAISFLPKSGNIKSHSLINWCF